MAQLGAAAGSIVAIYILGRLFSYLLSPLELARLPRQLIGTVAAWGVYSVIWWYTEPGRDLELVFYFLSACAWVIFDVVRNDLRRRRYSRDTGTAAADVHEDTSGGHAPAMAKGAALGGAIVAGIALLIWVNRPVQEPARSSLVSPRRPAPPRLFFHEIELAMETTWPSGQTATCIEATARLRTPRTNRRQLADELRSEVEGAVRRAYSDTRLTVRRALSCSNVPRPERARCNSEEDIEGGRMTLVEHVYSPALARALPPSCQRVDR